MNGILEKEQLRIINELRMGNDTLKEQYVMIWYKRIIEYVNTLNLKEEYKEDAIAAGIIRVLEMLDSYDFNQVKSDINVIFNTNIHRAIVNYLDKLLYFQKELNGIIYTSIYSYLRALLGKDPSVNDVIRYLNKYGLPEMPLNHISEGENIPEQSLLDLGAIEILRSAIYRLSERQLYILLSRNGWLGYQEKSIKELSIEFGCSEVNIRNILYQAKKKLSSNPKLLEYLEFKNRSIGCPKTKNSALIR